jgi:hypothetical protein
MNPRLASRYNLHDPVDFIRFLNSNWDRGILKYNLIDYSIFKHIIGNFEYRTNGFVIHDQFLKQNFPKHDFKFFYAGYGDDWGRVEFVNSSPSFAAMDYYAQTSMARYYPFVVQVAHEKAVIRRAFMKAAMRKMYERGLAHPTFKAISKGVF